MTQKTQQKNMNALITKIFGEENMEEWNSKEVQDEMLKLFKTRGKKSAKDPNAPKKNKTSYLFFCNEEREKVKKDKPELKTTEIITELSKRWNKLKESKKKNDVKRLQKYTKQAEEDKDRYTKEKEDYTPSEGEESVVKRKKKDPNAPKRGKNAYIFYCQDYREKVKKDKPDLKPTEIMKELGARWKKITDSTKKSDIKVVEKYKKLAEEDKDRYTREMSEKDDEEKDDEEKDDEVSEEE